MLPKIQIKNNPTRVAGGVAGLKSEGNPVSPATLAGEFGSILVPPADRLPFAFNGSHSRSIKEVDNARGRLVAPGSTFHRRSHGGCPNMSKGHVRKSNHQKLITI